MPWPPAESPHPAPPWEAPGVVEVADAVVTPFARGPLRTEEGPTRWVTGAVHGPDGTLVPSSQRRWQGDRHVPIAADPELVLVPDGVQRLEGTWLYAGHWSAHFGHFLLETLPNLWPGPSDLSGPSDRSGVPVPLAGVLAHRPVRNAVPPVTRPAALEEPGLAGWQRDLLDLAGYGGVPVRVVHGFPLRVDRLLVPARPVLLKRWAQPAAVELWRRASDAVGRRGPHPRVYLSRTRFHQHETGAERARTDPAWDAHLDDAFAAAGFAVVHPETLPLVEQVALVRGADVLAGLSGSALHLSVFARPGTLVVSVGDQRAPRRPVPTQRVVDAACGHRSAFVADHDRDGLAALLADL